MKKRALAVGFVVILLLSACGNSVGKKTLIRKGEETTEETQVSFDAAQMNEKMVKAAYGLEKSNEYSLDRGMIVTALGVMNRDLSIGYNDTYLLPAIEAKTGIHFNIDWKKEKKYSTAVATTILSDKDNLPDMISPRNFGVMDLADDGLIVPLDDYLYLMPDIIAAVGEDYLDDWRAADGHIYTIPSVSEAKGAYSTMVRKDWLEELGMDVPNSWSDWISYWRAVLDNDLNHNGNPHDEIPFAAATGDNGERSLIPLLNAYGIKTSADSQFCILDDGTYSLIYEHPRYNAFITEMAYLYSEGIISKEYLTWTDEDVENLMRDNRLATAMTYAVVGGITQEVRDSGDEDALWISTIPVAGPFGNRLIPERTVVSDAWCLTVAAGKRNKIEEIVGLFNWCFTKEGSYLLNYGIEGISYDMVEGQAVMNKELVANGYKDVLDIGIYCEPFGGLWLEEQYNQCIFAGRDMDNLADIQEEIYKGIYVLNEKYYYSMPKTIETEIYVKKRAELITNGICKARNQAIAGEISIESFWNEYNRLKKRGLEYLGVEAENHFNNRGDRN